jgi:hypothetical protein
MLPGGLQERHARLLRWLLITGWLALIASLLLPASPVPGNRIFWGTVVPSGLLVIAAISHELWRRLCPLAFASQLAHALGLQRSRPGKGNRPELVLIKPDSWLGRHHVQLQWSLLIAGLCLRLLGGNSDPIWLAAWLVVRASSCPGATGNAHVVNTNDRKWQRAQFLAMTTTQTGQDLVGSKRQKPVQHWEIFELKQKRE